MEFSVISFLPLIVYSLLLGAIAYFLAKDKGRNVTLWTVLGFIPIVNMVCIIFFVGAANKRAEEKLDAILARLG